MCVQVAKTAGDLMQSLKPELTSFLVIEGVSSETQTEVLNAYSSAYAALENWQAGSDATQVLELLNAALAVFKTLPVPAVDTEISGIILATFTAIIGLVQTHSPQQSQEAEAKAYADFATHAPQVKIKISAFHPAYKQQEQAWNNAVNAAIANGNIKWSEAYKAA
jgi:hypothetical protein